MVGGEIPGSSRESIKQSAPPTRVIYVFTREVLQGAMMGWR
jgi:hypothetical protein